MTEERMKWHRTARQTKLSLAENAANFSLVAELTLPTDNLGLLSCTRVPASPPAAAVSTSSSRHWTDVFFELRLFGLHGRRGFSSFLTTPLGVLDSDCEFDLLIEPRFLLLVCITTFLITNKISLSTHSLSLSNITSPSYYVCSASLFLSDQSEAAGLMKGNLLIFCNGCCSQMLLLLSKGSATLVKIVHWKVRIFLHQNILL